MREPRWDPKPVTDVRALLLHYLDLYRDAVARKFDGLTEAQARTAVLPSGWTPAQLVRHLTFMERRWFVWGFLGEDVDEPWGDDGPDGRWSAPDDVPVTDLVLALHAGGRRTRAVVEAADLETPARAGGRFPHDSTPPTLLAIGFHVLQEYARHTGQLDVVRELIDGTTGE
ncbi:MAG: DinB family protein [Angustibacter sp.]